MQDSSLSLLTKEVFFISSSAHLPNSWLVLACTEAWMTELTQGAQLQCEVVNEKGRGRALSSPFSAPKWQISSSHTVKLCSVNTDISPMLLFFGALLQIGWEKFPQTMLVCSRVRKNNLLPSRLYSRQHQYFSHSNRKF